MCAVRFGIFEITRRFRASPQAWLEGSPQIFSNEEFCGEPLKSSARLYGRVHPYIPFVMEDIPLYRRQNPHRVSFNAPDLIVDIEKIIETKGRNAHGLRFYRDAAETDKPREPVYLDLPARECIPWDEFKKRRDTRACENFLKSRGLFRRKPEHSVWPS